jgi:hypothetical protein
MPLSPQGRLWLDVLKMWLGQENGRAVCYDQQGQPIRTRVQAEQRAEQEAQARQLAEERAEQEAQARLLAEQRVEQEARARLLAEAEVARLRAQLLGRREEE